MRRVTVYEYERVVRYSAGRLAGVLEPGRHWLWRGGQRLVRFDVRPQLLTMPLQEMVTADGASVRLSLAATWRVADPLLAVQAAESPRDALWLHLQLAVRAPVGARTLDELLAARNAVGDEVLAAATPAAEAVGVSLDLVAVRDFVVPGELRAAFGDVIRARQEGLAALERARGEGAALRSLANAARVLESSPTLLQLRTLQAIESASGPLVVHLPSSTLA